MDPLKVSQCAPSVADQPVQYGELVNLTNLKNKQPISIYPNGALYTLQATKSSADLKLSASVLNVAAELLENKPIKLSEKEYKKTAKKMVKFYAGKERRGKKLSQEEKTALAHQFRSLGTIQMMNWTDAKLVDFATKYGIYSDQIVSEGFLTKGPAGIGTDAADFVRHIAGGIVEITVDNLNLYASAGIPTSSLTNIDSEIQKLKLFTDRVELVLDLFALKAATGMTLPDHAHLKGELCLLLDEMRSQDTVSLAMDVFQKHFDHKWSVSGHAAMLRLCRLLHMLNQVFIRGPSQITAYHFRDTHSQHSPYQLLQLANFQLEEIKGEKKIDIVFAGDQVRARHMYQFKQAGGSLAVDQIAEISSSLDLSIDRNRLDQWEFSQLNRIRISENENTDNATKIYKYWKLCGINSQLVF